jgi:hypothetical protein
MSLKSGDLKKLWGRSGNVCSFPSCGVELAQEKKANRVIGEEAHIKGEKPLAPRYDPNQPEEERESYENRILLCPTHHTEIDADPETWTVERLKQMKANREQQVSRNQQFPQVLDELTKIVQRFQASEESLELSVSEVIEDSQTTKIVRVDASKDGGINTNIKVLPGQTVVFFARGLISYDGRHHFATPEGILCNEYGIPFIFNDESGNGGMAVWPHPGAYKTNGNELGRIGSLIGWIGTYSEQGAFLIGSKREVQVGETGYLYLMVNDAKGTYSDNDGEFRVGVDIKIVE